MTIVTADPDVVAPEVLVKVRAEALGRTRRYAEQCILLATVTSTDVAAALIDQAVQLRASLKQAEQYA